MSIKIKIVCKIIQNYDWYKILLNIGSTHNSKILAKQII